MHVPAHSYPLQDPNQPKIDHNLSLMNLFDSRIVVRVSSQSYKNWSLKTQLDFSYYHNFLQTSIHFHNYQLFKSYANFYNHRVMLLYFLLVS